MLTEQDLNWFAARLSIAVYDTNRETPEMSAYELREALKGIPGSEDLTIGRSPNGNQIITIGDKTLEVSPMASNDEIILALQNPFIRTENTKITMASPLQGIGQKLAKLKHDAELDAVELSKTVDDLAARKDVAIGKAKTTLQGQGNDIADIEAFVSDVEKATNQ
jgi:hypothetical protein